MDDFIEFVKIVAQSPPQLSIALIGVAIRDAWMQIVFAGVLISGTAVLWWRWRKKRQSRGMVYHEFIVKPEQKEPATLPHVHCNCKATPVLAVENEDGFCEWYGGLVLETGVNFSENEARKLYAVKTRVRVEL